MLQHHHADDTHCPGTPSKRYDGINIRSRTQVHSNEDVAGDSSLSRRTQTEGSPSKEDGLDKVKSSQQELRCESDLTKMMENFQMFVIKQERTNDFPQHANFVEMTRPKKNGHNHSTTEYHIIKFVPCFENMTDDIDLDDTSVEEED
mmetsp:Transcript_33233/g.44308  ORF Transcript_33233/g.44308 Transcript_33233/m.44308 type:complete len:147 (-) Transcript_33233:89-529(-)